MSEVTFTEEESDEANMFGEERIAEFAPADVSGGDSDYPDIFCRGDEPTQYIAGYRVVGVVEKCDGAVVVGPVLTNTLFSDWQCQKRDRGANQHAVFWLTMSETGQRC